MEKPILIQFIQVTALAGLLLLAGCVTNPVDPVLANAADASAPVQTTPTEPAATPPAQPASTAAVANPVATPSVLAPVPTPKSASPVGAALQPITAVQAPSMAVASLTAPADLWERIRRGFAMPDLNSELVRDREQWYTTRPDYILRMTERSRKYMFHIVEELERRNMPTELALLPFIESAFNPQAVSSAKAAGMWQFMPATGKSFELRQNAFRDDRRDVLASTRAALDYLQKLYGMFGDWQLALAAYNWGEGSVGRAIAKNQRAGLGLTYTDLNMPNETRYYVPKLQAVKNIVARPTAFNSSLPDIGNHPYFQSVEIKRDIDVTLAAKMADVPLEDFKALNPSLNRPVIMAAGTPQILLPWDNAAVFLRNLDSFNAPLATWTVWLAPSTMRPSEAAKRTGMKESDLRSINNVPPGMLIRAGSSLLVPRSVRVEQDITEHVADNGQLSMSPEVVLKRRLVKAGKKDSVPSLAARYKVSPANVAEWNKISPTAALKAGQQVVLFLPQQGKARARNKAGAKSVAKTGAQTGATTDNSRKKSQVAKR
jgi:membrane-bound lytic murein transglycosylase D